jgi:hypothetical protein
VCGMICFYLLHSARAMRISYALLSGEEEP